MMTTSRSIPTKRLFRPLLKLNRSYHHGSNEEDQPANHKPGTGKLQREFILSVLQAQPSVRDSRLYLKSFAPTSKKAPTKAVIDSSSSNTQAFNPGFPTTEAMPTTATLAVSSIESTKPKEDTSIQARKNHNNNLAHSILSIPNQHTGLVKIQGPFTDRQLQSIVDGVIYLKTLGLMPIIILDDELWHHPPQTSLTTLLPHQSRPHQILHPINPSETRRQAIARETVRLSEMLESRGANTRPIYEGILRLTDYRNPDGQGLDLYISNLDVLKAAINNQEIPIIPPIAINSSCATIYISADDVVKSLAKGLAAVGKSSKVLNHAINPISSSTTSPGPTAASIQPLIRPDHQDDNQHGELDDELDLTPLRLMIINREGGIPSPARNGHPHLSINLASEYEFINETFRWSDTHPTSLANLSMARSCLKYLPNESSAIIVSHRSPKSLIANLITNKPAHSPSLKHSILLNFTKDIKLATPTLIRKGLPIKVIRGIENVDLMKMKDLLEKSFKKTLDHESFFNRLGSSLRFVIIAGDYQGAAIVTDEKVRKMTNLNQVTPNDPEEAIVYLDKFAVLPSLQGEGVVDFLWGALRDESFGLGNLDALNNNGGLSGIGEPVDLVWRSRSDNPVNRWYFERSNGFIKLPSPPSSSTGDKPAQKPHFSLFWCLADHPHDSLNDHNNPANPAQFVNHHQIRPAKLETWCRVVNQIPSSWKS